MEALPKGPFVKAALFCEKLLEEKDGVTTFVRVIDRVTHTIVAPNAPDSLPSFPYPMVAVVMLNPAAAKGRHTFAFSMESPTGLKREIGQGTVHFEGPERTVNIRMELTMQFDLEGLYWFDFELEGELLTRMPFSVFYNRIMPGTTSQ